MARLTTRVLSETWDYRLKDDRDNPPEEQIRWKLKQLPAAARRLIMQTTSIAGGATTIEVDRFWIACKHGIDSVENLFDDSGHEIVPKFMGEGAKRQLDDETVALFDEVWVYELGSAIIESTKLTDEEKKRCGLLPTQPTTATGAASAPPPASSPPSA